MGADVNARLVIDADTGGAVSGVKRLDAAIGGLDKSTGRGSVSSGRLGTVLKGLGVAALSGAAVGITGLAAATKFGVEQQLEQEAVSARTANVLKTTGNAAHTSQAQIEIMASALQRLTGTADDQIQAGANMLLTFTNVRNEAGKGNQVFNDAIPLINDLSVAMGQDMQSSAIQVGKALNDPIKGVTALQRVGVSFTAAQKDQIKTLVESGRTLDAQKIILRELNKEFGGAASHQGKTTEATQQLQRNWESLTQSIAVGMIPVLQRVIGGLNQLIAWAQANWPRFSAAVSSAFDQARTVANQVITWFRANVLPTIQAIVAGAKALWARYGADVQQAFAFVVREVQRALTIVRAVVQTVLALLRGDWGTAWNGLKTIVTTALKGVADTVRTALSLAVSVGTKLAGDLVRGIVTALQKLAAQAGSAVKAAMTAAVNAVRSAIGAATAAARAVGAGIVNGVKAGAAALAKLGGYLIGKVVSAINSVLSVAYSMASGIGSAIVNGVMSGISSLPGKLLGKLNDGIGWAMNHIDIPGRSPVDHAAMETIAYPIIDGTLRGLEDFDRRLGLKLSDKIRGAIEAAKQKAGELAGDLSSTIATAIDATSSAQQKALDNSPEAARMRQIEELQKARQKAADLERLQGAIDDAETAQDRKAAAQALADWQLDQERQALSDQLQAAKTKISDEADARRTASQQNLADLQDKLNRGLISQADYNRQLMGILAASGVDWQNVGTLLGSAFANGFAAQVAGLREVIGAATGAVPASNTPIRGFRGFATNMPSRLLGGPDVPKFATGIDYVPHDMLAQIHAGETVLNRSEAARYRAGRGTGGGVTVILTGGLEHLTSHIEATVDGVAERSRIRALAGGFR